jgi:hypothetical protein
MILSLRPMGKTFDRTSSRLLMKEAMLQRQWIDLADLNSKSAVNKYMDRFNTQSWGVREIAVLS